MAKVTQEMAEAGPKPLWLALHPLPKLFCSAPLVPEVFLFSSPLDLVAPFDPIPTLAFSEVGSARSPALPLLSSVNSQELSERRVGPALRGMRSFA